MQFSRLRLTGFKSFVDPTDLMIADGLTGVVGPNGCGKSNLLEALRWVMGENRPTAMRGGGMEDVIFAGAATRPARNFAEVSLLLDNSDRLAPAAFNDSDILEVVRRITRDVGSAYKANAKDVRARDVQMLFADASTGAHSPSLVRQGQISELINAKPKARRRILEEAAGISGLYQRRHEAELKLKGTETNLTRVDDVIEQLAAQLAQLARQARQAARYRAIGEELRAAEGQLLYRRWKEADAARAETDDALRARTTEAAQSEGAARKAAVAREEAEAALPPLREEDAIAAAVLQRLLVERDTLTAAETQAQERIAALEARIAQLTTDRAREADLNRDAEQSVVRLNEEAAKLEADGEGHEAALAEAEAAAHEAASVLQAREADLSQKTEDVARLAARHQSAERLLADLEKTVAKHRADAEAAETAQQAARTARSEAEARVAQLAEAQVAAQRMQTEAEATLVAAEEARAAAQSREADARAERSSAEGETKALLAEMAALDKLLRRDEADTGQLLDLLQVAPGYEKALGAALADDLRAPVLGAGETGTGWHELQDFDGSAELPEGVVPLSYHVAGPDVLQRRMRMIGVVPDEATGQRLHAALGPGQRLVSAEGDLWRWDGFHVDGEDAPSAAALRLEQLNRLEALKQQASQAEARLDAARQAHEALTARVAELTAADAAARQARRDADTQASEAARALSRAEADRDVADGKCETLALALDRHRDAATEAEGQAAEARGALKALPDIGAERAQVEDLRLTVEAARVTMMTRRSAFDELRREGAARLRRAQSVAQDLTRWQARLESAGTRIAEIDTREAEAKADLDAARDAPTTLASKRDELADSISVAEARKAEAADALSTAEGALREADRAAREAERAAGEAREARAAAEARAEAARDTVALAAQRIDEALLVTPDQLLASLDMVPEQMPPAERLEGDVARLKRQRDALGAVNLRAEEDAKEVQTEHDALVAEKADLENAVRELRNGIASLNREGRERLLTAFEQVNDNFGMLFKHLFGGGEASLTLVESDDPLDAGLEIMCQPPGKKLSTLSLLSGGEQTLTALALIFAVFLANPAPICVLDEVDAPLDDANVTRFCDLLDEMTRRTDTRFLIITHHAVTMARMDRLFGVTMQEQGVSQLVSVDLKKAEQLVA
ncbi:chromosome segregation protein SMC [Pseudaestuariivita atlantica]|uniref:Chromosome partition protein Smc n=1 Tax=Pseudaestuariivita atlantica TaxID=1317121 RepID=A0A0L1JSR6_9RHOB|nr:chromosome segregation protein SMC [Pseudaestuariivita atlantica]KNG94747.1 chromosome segregation protein SMC [Pseudaestuariivita atlantica]